MFNSFSVCTFTDDFYIFYIYIAIYLTMNIRSFNCFCGTVFVCPIKRPMACPILAYCVSITYTTMGQMGQNK